MTLADTLAHALASLTAARSVTLSLPRPGTHRLRIGGRKFEGASILAVVGQAMACRRLTQAPPVGTASDATDEDGRRLWEGAERVMKEFA